MNDPITTILRKNTDCFNYKTFGIEEFKQIMDNQRIFKNHKDLQFLPNEFHDFLDKYYVNPDQHIKIYDYDEYRRQFLKNILMPENSPVRYILFHRIIYNKIEPVKIQIVYIKNYYAVLRNFNFDEDIPKHVGFSFVDAFKMFWTN